MGGTLLQMCCFQELARGPVKIIPQCAYVCVSRPLIIFILASTHIVSPLILSVVSDAAMFLCLSSDSKFASDFQSIICTGRAISAAKPQQLITALCSWLDMIKMYKKTKTILSLSSAVNQERWSGLVICAVFFF